ncbi:hypothetical protein, unlikely [Trypanosoma congolense IL3000]|uniref:Uncharacterized protein n=1 Tax=Trypanosoma congolense (strain IL3000) TaxID=1068625 RepID=F9WF35_TRYCI|nr:hypothetical protein, unlikely [Trypanosoma congolense IL3000]
MGECLHSHRCGDAEYRLRVIFSVFFCSFRVRSLACPAVLMEHTHYPHPPFPRLPRAPCALSAASVFSARGISAPLLLHGYATQISFAASTLHRRSSHFLLKKNSWCPSCLFRFLT